jgi:putative transposase
MLRVLNQKQASAMNGHNKSNNDPDLINILLEDGLKNVIPKISELLMNAVVLLERICHIGANPNERNVEGRNGYANDFKPRSNQTALGKLQLQIPRKSQGLYTRERHCSR